MKSSWNKQTPDKSFLRPQANSGIVLHGTPAKNTNNNNNNINNNF